MRLPGPLRLRACQSAALPLVAALSLTPGCTRQTTRDMTAALIDQELRTPPTEILPGVRVDLARKQVEFDAVVAVDCHDPETPDVYLEVVCCGRDSREHEALVVTDVPASHVHAALLAVGAEPGHPGSWRREAGRVLPVEPSGEPVLVHFVVTQPDGSRLECDAGDWVRARGTGRSLRESLPGAGWVFAGSRIRSFDGRDVYDADGTGQVIGLHTFGSESIAWTHVESPDSGVDEPRWLTQNDLVPAIGTPVTVRLIVADRSRPSG